MGPCYTRSRLASAFSFPGAARPQARFFPGPPRPRPGFTFVRTKVNRKSASLLWAGPRLLPNRTQLDFDSTLPLNVSFCLRLPRNRSGDCLTPPVGPRDDRHFSFAKQIDSSTLFKRATAEVGIETWLRLDARRIFWFSGSVPSKFDKDRLDKGFQNHGFWRVFGYFLHEQKVPGGTGARSPCKSNPGVWAGWAQVCSRPPGDGRI